MTTLFNYTTLSTRLEKTTRTLFVTLNRPDWKNAFRLEMLFELESLLSWCMGKVEINSIHIDSSTPFFSTGVELENLPNLTAEHLDKINTKLKKITYSMMSLPQTVIVDLGQGCETLASEFALGADIRMCSQRAKISFNHAHYGLVPAAGGMCMLGTLVSPSFARTWILSGLPVDERCLRESGLVTIVYDEHSRLLKRQELLEQICALAPVQRIQSKLALFESLREKFELGLESDRKIAKASMLSEDWRSKKPQEKDFSFMPAKSMSYSVKLSLIKSDEGHEQLEH